MLVGLRPLWNSQRRGIVCVLVGSVLLSVDLMFISVMVGFVMWHDSGRIAELDLRDILALMAMMCNVSTIILLAMRTKRAAQIPVSNTKGPKHATSI